jgi:hypothetical protein
MSEPEEFENELNVDHIVYDESYRLDSALKIKSKLIDFIPNESKIGSLSRWRQHFQALKVPYIVTHDGRYYTLWKEGRV